MYKQALETSEVKSLEDCMYFSSQGGGIGLRKLINYVKNKINMV